MHTPETKKFEHLEREVLDKIMNIYGDRGERIVGYLNTAHQLLEIKEDLISMNFNLPKLPETIAYCIREALTEPLETVGIRNKYQLLDCTSMVIKEKDNYASRTKQAGHQRIDLEKLLAAIEKLRTAEAEVETKNKARLRELLKESNLASENLDKIIKRYDDLIKRVQKSVHKKTSGKEVEEMWTECLCVHKTIYSNPEFRIQLDPD